MTITLTAVPDLATGSVDLTVTATTETVTALYRQDANGIRAVRTLLDLFPMTASSVALVDAEASLKGTVTYQAMTAAGASEAVTVELGLPDWWIVDPLYPGYAVNLPLVLTMDSTRESLGTTHRVIGRRDKVAALAPLGLRDGTWEFWCATYEDAVTIEAMYAQGRPLLLRQGAYAGMDTYHRVEGTSLTPLTLTTPIARWSLRVSYSECLPPTGPVLATVGWDYDGVVASYEDYTAVQFAYASYNALTLGDPT